MPVIYAGISIRPAPTVDITKTTQTLGDGRVVGTTITATLHGTIVATKTNDTETAINIESRLSTIIAKQKVIRDQFAVSGQWFEIQGYDGLQNVKFIATVESIDFSEGPWVDKCDYTIALTGETLADSPGDANHIESASESWQYEEADGPHTYRATHTLQAKGKTFYETGGGTVTKRAWEWAKDFVQNKLTLDWTGTEAKWSPKAGKDIFEAGLIQPENSFNAYNRVISENIDESDGSYSITETFFLATTPFWEEYTVSVRKELSDPKTGNVVSISGVIHGLATQLHSPESRLANALAQWGTVKTLLYSRASAYATGVTLNSKHTVQSYDINVNDGTVSYQYEFNDRILTNHTTEFYNVSMQASLEDTKTVVTIDGVITGELYPDDVYNPLLRYSRALAQWNLVKSLLFGRCITDSGVIDLQPFPVAASMTPNKADGSVSYNFSFDNRIPDKVKHEYSVSTRFGRDDGRTVITIDGTITGLRFANASQPFSSNNVTERYDNAKDYFDSVSDNLVGLAATYVDIAKVNPIPFSETVSHVPNGGQVSYQLEFNSNPAPCVVGALSENITVTDDAAVPLVAVIPILGRAKGPIIQDIGTVKEKRRSVAIEVVMPTDFSTTNMCDISSPPSINIALYAPKGNPVYLEQDQTQWSPSTGHFSRTLSWIYE